MYLNTDDPRECCGCTACVTVCPTKCIGMVSDEFGFKFPKMLDPQKCIHCHRCERVCPFGDDCRSEVQELAEPRAYYGWHCDRAVRARSTSGAAFVALAERWMQQENSYCVGVTFDQDLVAKHAICSDAKDVGMFVSSKYVQSDMDRIYDRVLDALMAGGRVLFSGTPCQVQGLINLVPKNGQKNLVTVSLVCHGVASPAAFMKYLESSSRRKGRVERIRFRDKKTVDGVTSYKYTTVEHQGGRAESSITNPYTIMFGIGMMHRESCSNCPFATPNRACDLTIGDFWGIEHYDGALADELNKGVSLVLTHTSRGEELLEAIGGEFFSREVPLAYALNLRQQQLTRPFQQNSRRDMFLDNVVNKGKDYIAVANFELMLWKIGMLLRRLRAGISRRLHGLFERPES